MNRNVQTPGGQRPPQQGQQRPAQPGQRPVQQGQQRPVQQGQQRPTQPGQRPVQQGQQRPVQPGQRPVQQGQRPTQPGQRPMQQGQRPNPQRPNGQRPMPPQKSEPNYLAIILVALACLLVVALITVGVVLAVNAAKDNDRDKDRNEGGYEQEDDDPIPTNPPAQQDGVKTALKQGGYQIGQAEGFEYVEGISPDAAILVDLASFEMVAGVDFDKRICPASMTKVMTVLIACENLMYLTDTVTVTQDAVNYQATHGASGFGLTAGDTLTVKDLLYLIYYRSDTIACLMMSEYIAGSESGFVKLMNDKVKAMGLTNTKFSNSTGLYFEGDEYYTTCRDMAAIMAHALENSLARSILTQTGTYYISAGQYRGQAIGPGWKADSGRLGSTDYAGMTIMGGKTGYETVSGSCLITYAKSKTSGKEYIQVVVGGKECSNATCSNYVKHIYTNYAD